MEEEVRKRIRHVLDAKNVKVNTLAVKYNENQSKLSKQIKYKTAISLHTILLLLDEFPDLSTEWLLRGKGNMFLTTDANHSDLESRIARLEQLINNKTN